MEDLQKPKNHSTKIIIGSIIVLILVSFSIQNSGPANVKFLFWEGAAPLVLLFLICFLLGLSFALLALFPLKKYSNKQAKYIKELNTKIEILEKQKNNTNKDSFEA
jgi:uncharacterized integral membrane protein